MYKKIAKLLIVSLILNMVIMDKQVYANEKELDIISNKLATVSQMKEWAKTKGATETFISLADMYYKLSKEHGGVNPTIAYAQAAIETGYGKFGGVLDESFKNPCGLKTASGGTDQDKEAHHRFQEWEHGIKAHLDHLALYAGVEGYPRKDTYDPRHFKSIFGTAKKVEDLSGKWATDKEYGKKIKKLTYEMANIKKPILKIDKLQVNNEELLLKIEGWGVSTSLIKNVEIYIDGKYVVNANYGLTREDVNNYYGEYPGSLNSGFESIIDLRGYKNGKYIVEIVANDINGEKIKNKSEIYIKTKDNIMVIDTDNKTIYEDTIEIRGWAISDYEIDKVEIYIDDKYVIDAHYGIERPDVKKVYNNYKNALNSGYRSIIDINGYSKGKHKVTVKVKLLNGDEFERSSQLDFFKKDNIIWIDTPGERVYDNQIEVTGWTVNNSLIKKVEVYLDNKYIVDANYGIERKDVENVYGDYKNSLNSGYRSIIGLSEYKTGKHELKIKVINIYNEVEEKSLNFEIKRKKDELMIDLAQIYNDKGDLEIEGWAISGNDIEKVQIYLNGKYIIDADYGRERRDVFFAYPQYDNSLKSGYKSIINVDKNGKNNVTVRCIKYDGTYFEQNIEIEKIEKAKKIVLDSGHNIFGFADTGSNYTHNGVKYEEAQINMNLTVKLKEELENKGYEVILTNTPFGQYYGDSSVASSLERRVKVAENSNADLFISIHHNNFYNTTAKGSEVFYSNPKSLEINPKPNAGSKSMTLAKTIAPNLAKVGGFVDRGAKNNNFFVTNRTTMPAILIEAGFLSNPSEAKKAADYDHQKKVSIELSKNIDSWIKKNI